MPAGYTANQGYDWTVALSNMGKETITQNEGLRPVAQPFLISESSILIPTSTSSEAARMTGIGECQNYCSALFPERYTIFSTVLNVLF